MKINFELEDAIGMALAFSRGWRPTIDDETQAMVGDEFPQIPNPITPEQFIEKIIPPFVSELILNEGRNQVINNFTSIFKRVEDQVANGAFDSLILQGDIEGINNLVKGSL